MGRSKTPSRDENKKKVDFNFFFSILKILSYHFNQISICKQSLQKIRKYKKNFGTEKKIKNFFFEI